MQLTCADFNFISVLSLGILAAVVFVESTKPSHLHRYIPQTSNNMENFSTKSLQGFDQRTVIYKPTIPKRNRYNDHHGNFPRLSSEIDFHNGLEKNPYYAGTRPQFEASAILKKRDEEIQKPEENKKAEETGTSGETAESSESSPHEDSKKENEEHLSPFEQAFKNLTTPDLLIPVVNDLTFITLIILHLPAIIPTILIPLSFFAVGSLLIPIVRVNYFINHQDNGEDGRHLHSNSLSHIFSSIYDTLW